MFHLNIKEIDTNIRVSRTTFYKVANNEIGTYINKNTYQITLETLKKFKKLYNRVRRM